VVLRPTRHRIGHLGDVFPSQSLNWLDVHAFANLKKCTATQKKKTKGHHKFSRLLRHVSGLEEGAGLLSKEEITKGGDK